jgi:hypothetical protein
VLSFELKALQIIVGADRRAAPTQVSFEEGMLIFELKSLQIIVGTDRHLSKNGLKAQKLPAQGNALGIKRKAINALKGQKHLC